MGVNVARALEKWKANTASAAEAMKEGVKNVTQNPAELAAAAKDKWIANVQKAASEGRFEKGLSKVTLSDWKDAMVNKGASNMANGARALTPRAAKAITDVVQYTDSVKSQVASMPNVTEADADARMLAAVNLMRKYKSNS